MLVLESKLKARTEQYNLIEEAIRTALFCRNKALRYWMDNYGTDKYDLNKYMPFLAKEFSFAKKLNSQARQASIRIQKVRSLRIPDILESQSYNSKSCSVKFLKGKRDLLIAAKPLSG
jgi:transposase